MTEQEELVMEQESKYKIIEFIGDALKTAIDKQDDEGILYIARALGDAHKMALDYCPGGKHGKVVIVEDWLKHQCPLHLSIHARSQDVEATL